MSVKNERNERNMVSLCYVYHLRKMYLIPFYTTGQIKQLSVGLLE